MKMEEQKNKRRLFGRFGWKPPFFSLSLSLSIYIYRYDETCMSFIIQRKYVMVLVLTL